MNDAEYEVLLDKYPYRGQNEPEPKKEKAPAETLLKNRVSGESLGALMALRNKL